MISATEKIYTYIKVQDSGNGEFVWKVIGTNGNNGTPQLINYVTQAFTPYTLVGTAIETNPAQTIVGNAASGTTDSGAPLKIGSVFNTAQPTVTTGQRIDNQATARGALIVSPGVDNTPANAWFTKITDGTNTAAIKAASTAPVAADSSQVVSISPNSTMLQGVAAGTAATQSTNVGGVFNTNLPTITNGQGSSIQFDNKGRLIQSIGASNYINNILNTTNLASGATFTSAIIDVLSAPAWVVSVRATQDVTIVINQFSDAAGTLIVETSTFTRLANVPLNTPIKLSGSYAQLVITNNGGASTTSLLAEAWSGVLETLPTSLTNSGNLRVAVLEGGNTTGVFNTTKPTLTNGQTAPLQFNSQGDLQVETTNQKDIIVTGAVGQSILNNNILLSTAGAAGFDTIPTIGGSYQSFYAQVNGSAGISAGQIIFEGSNDNFVSTAIPLQVFDDTVVTGAVINTAQAIAANTVRYFSGKTQYRQIRCRISTAFVGGTVSAITRFSPVAYIPRINNVAVNQSLPTGTNSIGNISTVSSVTTVGSSQNAFNFLATDVASAALTTNTTTAAITPTWGTSYQVSIPVTIVTGTTPTMSVAIQESFDNGTNWFDVYTFPLITAVGVYNSPKVNVKGNRVRYVQTVTGTTPSFTRSVIRIQSNEIVTIQGGIPVITNSTITTGGTSQIATVARVNRNYLEVLNTSAADLWINFNGVNAGINAGFRISAGSSWSPVAGTCPESSVTIFGATTGQTFAISQY